MISAPIYTHISFAFMDFYAIFVNEYLVRSPFIRAFIFFTPVTMGAKGDNAMVR